MGHSRRAQVGHFWRAPRNVRFNRGSTLQALPTSACRRAAFSALSISAPCQSFPRKRESPTPSPLIWSPACAGVTAPAILVALGGPQGDGHSEDFQCRETIRRSCSPACAAHPTGPYGSPIPVRCRALGGLLATLFGFDLPFLHSKTSLFLTFQKAKSFAFNR